MDSHSQNKTNGQKSCALFEGKRTANALQEVHTVIKKASISHSALAFTRMLCDFQKKKLPS